ncbi:MAG: DUF885 domain-containing protein, partial [Gemmatimonadetes bacterium]|nr:DUF885 domain-containing protein [Gemmatimonadota bacterium]
GAAAQVGRIADAYVAAYFEAFPHQSTLLGVAGGPDDRLPDISAAARARWEAVQDRTLAELEAVDTTAVAPGSAAAVTHGFLRELIGNARGFRACQTELWNVSPTWTGWQSEFSNLTDAQPVATPAQRDAAHRRYAALPRYLEQETANLREGLGRGYSAPKGNVRAVIRQMDALLAAPVAESPFVAMAPDTAREFRARMEALETGAIRPAIRRYRDFLASEYLPRARDAVGVAANPDGAACYRAAVRHHATVAMSPEEVHRIGLEQMATIRAEMREIARRSFGSEDVGAVLQSLRTDPRYTFTSREQKLAAARAALERARAAVPRWFGLLPKADVVVEPVAAFAEESAPGGFYNPPAEDGSRPGIYYINLYQAAGSPRAGLESTAFHETYPGHHLQGGIALERRELHPAQRYFYLSGFGEGWGLYSERLADEMGLFGSDVDRMGLLSNEALRAARLVVDAGMHALGWSRQQAIDYMLQNTAESEASVTAEVDRYIAVPGQATSYMLGNLEIRRLREHAKARLGERFDIREFHDRVLEDGAVPLMMLRAKIERWVAGQPAR